MLSELFQQAKQIEKLINRISDTLRSRQLIEMLIQDRIANPEQPIVAGLLAAAQSIKSAPIILYGLREYIDSRLEAMYPGQDIRSELLPEKEAIESRPQDWLSVGDVLIGYGGVTHDERGPRVIVEALEDGYTWRYLAEPEMEARPARFDRFFQRRDWVKCELASDTLEEQLQEISEMQTTEIAALEAVFNQLSSREF